MKLTLTAISLLALSLLPGCEVLREFVSDPDTVEGIATTGESIQEVAPFIPFPFGAIAGVLGIALAGWRNSQVRLAIKDVIEAADETIEVDGEDVKINDLLAERVANRKGAAKLVEAARPDRKGSLPLV